MGFVRVAGYGQSDLDNKYQEGYNDGVSAGYDIGATEITANPCMILAKFPPDNPINTMVIDADREVDVNVHILNNTTHPLMIILNGVMSGRNPSATITVNGESTTIEWLIAQTITFPVGGDLHFYQEKVGGTENEQGSIFLTITGKRSNDSFTNNIIWTDSEDKTEGTATFTTLLS